jgi:hypothetical protein
MTHADLINLWPSLSDFATDLSIEYGTAKAMRRRSSIPSEYWMTLVRAAETREINGVTLEALAAAVAAPTPEQAA